MEQQLRLHTFGGVALLVGGQTTTGSSTRRRRLALLALLAVARDRGLSRDKVQAYVWPESDTERARHGLNQLVYFQRRHLGGGELFLGRKTLRLNREVITTDVWEFDDALTAGANESAVRLYAGPFLDGFFLRGVPGFERWVDDQRSRLADRCANALGALAAAAAARGDHHQAVEWWRRAAELNPLDADTALHLLEAWIATGNRAAAVQHAERYEQLLHSELGLAPDPRMVRLAAQLRTGPGA